MDVRTLFISDFHLGSRHAASDRLHGFLCGIKTDPPEQLYIVGDAFDFWQIRRWRWDIYASSVVHHILDLSRRGVVICWIIGNHDAAVLDFLDDLRAILGGTIQIRRSTVHVTLQGKKLLVTHGDELDPVRHADWLFHLGDWAYRWLEGFDALIRWGPRLFGFRPPSLAQYLVDRVKHFVHTRTKLEALIIADARARGFDGIVCGHSHVPALREEDGFIYANTGDWMTSLTAICEDTSGRLHLRYPPQPRHPE